MRFLNSTASEPNLMTKAIVLGGEAGEGIKSAGKILSLALIKTNYNTFLYDEYPSLIRGGHNSVNVTYTPYPIYCPNKEIDILVCLDKATFYTHKEYLNKNSFVIYDRAEFTIDDHDLSDSPCQLVEIPASDIARKNKLPRITQNIIYLTAGLCLIGVDQKIIEEVITQELGKKVDLLKQNLLAVQLSYDEVIEYYGVKSFTSTEHKPLDEDQDTEVVKPQRYLMTGNEALSLGAIRSGMQFYAAYPMTPASTILDFMSAHYREFDIIVKQTEDEIAAINMAIGAAYAGSRAMVGTSGGGFSLMVEGVGLAAITETPLVITVSQRPGPATGLPTWTGQADLLFILHASQDEFPRVILTPTDIEECYYLSFLAFNIAEKYQIPVFILVDKYLSESMQILEFNPERGYEIERGTLLNTRMLSRLDDFHRYEITENGISPRSRPGQPNGIFLANSDEGDVDGYTSESALNRKQKVDKRAKKIATVRNMLPDLNAYGDMKSKLTFITWGSTKGAVLEAMRRLSTLDKTAKLLAINWIEPFPKDEVENFIKNSKFTVIVEGNSTSQLSQLIRMHTGYHIENQILKYDGRPIYPDEIVEYILNNE